MSRAKIPSKTAFETALGYLKNHNLDKRGFSVSPDGTITVAPADKAPTVSAYDSWKQQEAAQ